MTTHLTKDTKKKRSGFTLTELLTVIVIVGVLSAIALPTFLGQTLKAKLTECNGKLTSTLKQAHADYQLKGSEDDAINAAILANTRNNFSGKFGYNTYLAGGAAAVINAATPAQDLNPADILIVGADPAIASEPDQELIKASTSSPLISGKLFACINLRTGKVDIDNTFKDSVTANVDGSGTSGSVSALNCL